MNRTTTLLIAASIALNILLAGIVIGQAMRPTLPRGPQWGAIQDVSPATRTKVRAHLDRVFDERSKQASDRSRDELVRLLTAPTFDRAAYEAKLAAFETQQQDMHHQMGQAITELAATMTQEERTALAQALQRHGRPDTKRTQGDKR